MSIEEQMIIENNYETAFNVADSLGRVLNTIRVRTLNERLPSPKYLGTIPIKDTRPGYHKDAINYEIEYDIDLRNPENIRGKIVYSYFN